MRRDSVVDGWQARVRDAVAAGSALRLRGGGSKDFYGGAPAGELLRHLSPPIVLLDRTLLRHKVSSLRFRV